MKQPNPKELRAQVDELIEKMATQFEGVENGIILAACIDIMAGLVAEQDGDEAGTLLVNRIMGTLHEIKNSGNSADAKFWNLMAEGYDKPMRFKTKRKKCQAQEHVVWIRAQLLQVGQPEAVFTGIEPISSRAIQPLGGRAGQKYDDDTLNVYPDGSMSLDDGELIVWTTASKRGEAETVKTLNRLLAESY